jgi:hypothetical protein
VVLNPLDLRACTSCFVIPITSKDGVKFSSIGGGWKFIEEETFQKNKENPKLPLNE